MIDIKEQETLREIVQEYKQAEKELLEIEKMQNALRVKFSEITHRLNENRVIEQKFLLNLKEKYNREFSANELYEIFNLKTTSI